MRVSVQGRRFNIFAIAQAGRLEFEAVILAASLRLADPGFSGRLIFGEPQPGPLWPTDPRVSAPVRELLTGRFGAEIVPIPTRHFGAAYPQGNKIEGLDALPAGEAFLFLDTDTLVTGALSELPFAVARPSASMRREGTWPKPTLYGPGIGEIWAALYDRFGLDLATTLDTAWPAKHWERYLSFNAGWFNGPCPRQCGHRFGEIARTIRDDPPDALLCQALVPWLDQIALPLVIHGLGGGRPGPELAGMDGAVTCHYRYLPMLYARESDRAVQVLQDAVAPNPVKKVLKAWEPAKRMIYQGKGAKARALFDRANLPQREEAIRNTLRKAGLWMR